MVMAVVVIVAMAVIMGLAMIGRTAGIGRGDRPVGGFGGLGKRARRLPALAEEVGREPGADRRDHRRQRPEDGDDRVHQRVAEADRIDPGLGRRDQEGDGRPLGCPLAPEPERGRQHAAGAERQRHAQRRRPEHRSDLAGAEEPHQGPGRHHDREHAREREAEQQEDRGFLQDPPGLDADLEQEIDHPVPPESRPETAGAPGRPP